MVKEKNIETLENSSVRLSVTIDKSAVEDEYSNLVKTYTKSARIKGFRKGKVPPAILEQKFGDSLRAEASMNLVEKSLKEIFDEIEEKALPYSVPEVEGDTEIERGKDFSFSVKYDVYPEVQLGNYKGLEIEQPSVTIGKEDVNRELEKLQEQNSVVIQKPDGKVENNSIITMDYWEVDDEGQEIEGTRRKDFTFTVGTGYNLYKIDEDVIGMEKDEEKTIHREYPDDFEDPSLAGTKKNIHIKVTEVKEKQLPPLDDELAQDIDDSYKTLKDLTDDIKKRLKEDADRRLEETTEEKILTKIAENSHIDIPESMIRAETDNSWRHFLQSYHAEEDQMVKLLKAQGTSKEKLLEAWRPQAIERIRKALISSALLKAENIEVTDEEYEKELEHQAEIGQSSLEEIREYIQQNNIEDYIKDDLALKKLFDKLVSMSNIKRGSKIKYLDLLEKKQ